ncbi:aldehyde dehydrogenase family protein [Burkholderia sp. SCN-KJ]|uniref:aldehyde dehydrogenase family protein n=1 Tax=Burkholderia sp. SCN-KJ TaxID=2969248 RepID=UPI0021500281|nr:aldehyde dehydrogenase family protein [Burkholderia sp. SCN-KJ]MCR4471587.1 aldehyde dehydrogenase family protein [Burkholderia sp. SCN-KJ]
MSFLEKFGIKRGQVFIDGAWVDSASSERREILNPKDETLVEVVAAGCVEDAERAVAAARAALPAWAALSARERVDVLEKYNALISEHASDLVEILTAEQGKLTAEGQGELWFAGQLMKHAAESARRIEGEILPGDNRDEQIWIQKVPYGVVAGITAWNFPVALFARKLGPALATGNTIVIKPHEITPLSTLVLAELGRRAGIPAGVLNVIVGDGRTVGAHLVTHPHTDLVSVTGSARAGEEIYALGAKRMKPLRLELGGKSPFIVMDDADVDRAVEAAFSSKFFSAGTTCTANDRMYLHASIYDQFVEKFVKRVNALTIGDPKEPVDIGPRVNASEVAKLRRICATATVEGAVQLNEKREELDHKRGHWFGPAVFEVPKNDLMLMKEENFGPVIGLMKVLDFDEAIKYANETEYGLSAFLFTRDNRRIMRMIQELHFGEHFINRGNGESVFGFHTGYKRSGLGGEDGKHGVEGYLRKKTVYNHFA